MREEFGNEGVEKLFHYVQIMVATHFDKARFGTVGTCADEYLEWKEAYPKSNEDLSGELGVDYISGQHILAAGMLHPKNLLDIPQNFTLFIEDRKIRDLGYNWGTCGQNNDLYFHWRVAMLPHRLIEYIVTHELVHLIEKKHNQEFWENVETILPDYGDRVRWLATNGVFYNH